MLTVLWHFYNFPLEALSAVFCNKQNVKLSFSLYVFQNSYPTEISVYIQTPPVKKNPLEVTYWNPRGTAPLFRQTQGNPQSPARREWINEPMNDSTLDAFTLIPPPPFPPTSLLFNLTHGVHPLAVERHHRVGRVAHEDTFVADVIGGALDRHHGLPGQSEVIPLERFAARHKWKNTNYTFALRYLFWHLHIFTRSELICAQEKVSVSSKEAHESFFLCLAMLNNRPEVFWRAFFQHIKSRSDRNASPSTSGLDRCTGRCCLQHAPHLNPKAGRPQFHTSQIMNVFESAGRREIKVLLRVTEQAGWGDKDWGGGLGEDRRAGGGKEKWDESGGEKATYAPMSGMASGKYCWKNSMTWSPVVIFSNSSKGMKSVHVKVLSCRAHGQPQTMLEQRSKTPRCLPSISAVICSVSSLQNGLALLAKLQNPT